MTAAATFGLAPPQPGRRVLLAVLFAGVGVLLAACAADPIDPTFDASRDWPPAMSGPSAGCDGDTARGEAREPTEHEVEVDGVARRFRLATPAVTGGEPAPLLVVLHGLATDADDMVEYTAVHERAEPRGVVTVYPDGGGLPSRWSLPGQRADEADLAWLVWLVEHLADELCVDLDRVVLAGISNGAAFSAVAACELPGWFAAVLAVGGLNLVEPCPDGEPLPLVAVHGTRDRIVPYGGGRVLGGIVRAEPMGVTMRGWAARNGCGDPTPEEWIGEEVVRVAWTGCAAATVLYRVEGGGHSWPGADPVRLLGPVTDEVDASDLAVALALDPAGEH